MSQPENTNFYRLIKLTKEFNVGLHTLVDALEKKGVKVELNPNAKIDEQAYAFLVKEYGHEISLKAAAQKVDLKPIKEGNVSLSLEEEPVAVPKPVFTARPVTPPTPSTPGPIPVSIPVPEPVAAPVAPVQPVQEVKEEKIVETPEPPKAELPEEPVKVPGLKILGKIDLDQTAVKTKPVEEKVVEKVVEKPAQVEEVIEKMEEKAPADKPEVEIKVEVAPVEKPIEVVDRTEVLQPKEVEIKKAITPVVEVPVVPVVPVVEAVIPPIVQKEATAAVVVEAEKAAEDDTHIETVYTKLTGPNVVGKIDLAQFAKKPVVKTDKPHFEDKKKRARIEKKVKVSVDPKTSQGQNGQGGGAAGANKPPLHHNHPKGKPPVGGVKKPAFQQVDEEAVQKQIKDTLARLTAKGSKTKSSKYSRDKREKYSQRMSEEMERQEMEKSIIQVTEFVTVSELANLMDVPVNQVIGACMNLGLMVSINQRLDAEALVLVAEEFGFQIEFVSVEAHDAKQDEVESDENLTQRPPIVAVMGHVDHGKTSLLDSIRKSNVIAGEAGGITQHIGAYNVKLPSGRRITFLDTPGHEAFTAMRARGAKVTDVAIIIVAADDSVMPQTIEAINHAQAAGVPMVFAINKIDKPGANGEKIREQLAQMNILVEDWGGKFQVQEVSAKQGKGIDELLEKVLFEADLLDLKANPDRPATGSVIESSLDKGRGYVATVLVENGSLRVGDTILSGYHFGKIKAMFNERGKKTDVADPATPVLILGLNGAPQAGENFQVLATDKEAREIANKREQLIRMQGIRATKHITLDEIGRRIAIGNFKELNIIVKADFDGSVEAMTDSMIKLSTEQVQVNVIHKAVGAISESDVMLAAASNAIIVGFQVRPTMGSRKLAEKEEIEIRTYSIIYDAINEIKAAIEGMHAPEMKEEVTCTVEVLEVFKITKVGSVAGCMVREGKINRNTKIRVLRDGIVIHTGSLGSLKRFKDDVKEVSVGFDCGLNIDNFNEIKVGDMVEGFEMVEVKK